MNAFRRGVLLAPFEAGGGSGIRGDGKGQDINIQEVVRNFRGDPRGHAHGVMSLRRNPLLLGYVASFHESGRMRSLAMGLLRDPRVLCIVVRSGNHPDSVMEAFEKIGGRLAVLDPLDRHLVACCAPSGEMRHEALSLLRGGFSMMILDSRGREYGNILSGVDWKNATGVHDILRNVGDLEKNVLNSGPLTEEQITRRRGKFVPENLEALLSRG